MIKKSYSNKTIVFKKKVIFKHNVSFKNCDLQIPIDGMFVSGNMNVNYSKIDMNNTNYNWKEIFKIIFNKISGFFYVLFRR